VVALSQVVVQTREDAAAYMQRLNAAPAGTIGVVFAPAAPADPPTLAQALAAAQAGSGEQGYDGPAGL
jgi:hypothetical protein